MDTSVYAAIADHIRDLVLNEICPTANIDITRERGGLTVRLGNVPRDNAIENRMALLEDETDSGTQEVVGEPAGGTTPATYWFVSVHITTAHSAPLVTISRIVTDDPVTRVGAPLRVDMSRPTQSDPLREALLMLCRHLDDPSPTDQSSVAPET